MDLKNFIRKDVLYDEQYFREKFPTCGEEVIDLLVKIATDKIVDKKRKRVKKNNSKIEISINTGDFVLDF